MHSTIMNTNEKFQEFIKANLTAEEYNYLKFKNRESKFIPLELVKHPSSENVIIIEQFLESLPAEEASEYVTKYDDWGNLFFHAHVDILRIIIKYIPNINVKDPSGWTALMVACHHEQIDELAKKVKFLLDCGANVNVRSTHDNTALMWCAERLTSDNIEIIEQTLELLIFSGADVNIRSTRGTAFDHILHKHLLSERLTQLLQGTIAVNRTKRALMHE